MAKLTLCEDHFELDDKPIFGYDKEQNALTINPALFNEDPCSLFYAMSILVKNKG